MNNNRLDKNIDLIIKYVNAYTDNKFKIDKYELIRGLYFINLQIYNLYLLQTSNLTKMQKIKKLSRFKSPDGDNMFTKKQAEFILNKYATNLTAVCNYIYSLQKDAIKLKKHNIRGGSLSPKTVQSPPPKSKKFTQTISPKLPNIDNMLDIATHTISSDIPKVIVTNIINWVFFPLWSLENIPLLGNIFEAPLDIIGIIIDNSSIVFKGISPMTGIVLDSTIDIIQAIPAVGTVASAIAIPLNFIKGPVEYLIANAADILGLYINIARKQWGLAYMSALNTLPMFSEIMDSVMTNLYTINKWFKKVNRASYAISSIVDKMHTYIPICKTLLLNPKILFDIKLFVNNLLKPNKHRIPVLKNMTDEEFVKITDLLILVGKDPNKFWSQLDIVFDKVIIPLKNIIPGFKTFTKEQFKDYLIFSANKGIVIANKGVGLLNDNINFN